jgi:hypothetical protein
MRPIRAVWLSALFALAACFLGLVVGIIGTSSFGTSALHPNLLERRQMAAAVSSASDSPGPVKALTAPSLSASGLAAKLDAAESADAPPVSKRTGRREARRNFYLCRTCRLALERRVENLE